MSMSTSITGYRDTKEHERHLRVLEFCRKEEVTIPKETAAYLGNASWDSADAWSKEEIDEKLSVKLGNCVSQPDSESEDRWEISVKDIPPGVTRIRFTNSY